MNTDEVQIRAIGAPFPVTLIIPVRNEEADIVEFLESVDRQTVSPDRIIITDGGSTDRTKALIRDFFAGKPRFKLIEEADAYPGRARNLAIEDAMTDWIAMTDAGTVVEPDWLEKMIQTAADEPACDVVFGSYEPVLSSFFQECLALAFVAPAGRIGEAYARGPSTASLLIKKTVWNEAGRFPEHLRACEDLIFFERLLSPSCRIARAPEAIVRWKIPDTVVGAFRKFRTYSCHTLRAGLARRWHVPVARMYAVTLVSLALGFFHHWAWLLLPPAGLVWRAHRSITLRRPSLKLSTPVGLHVYAVVALILSWIDAAAASGAVDFVVSILAGRDKSRGQAGTIHPSPPERALD